MEDRLGNHRRRQERRQYNRWMRNPIPLPPRATEYNYRLREEQDGEGRRAVQRRQPREARPNAEAARENDAMEQIISEESSTDSDTSHISGSHSTSHHSSSSTSGGSSSLMDVESEASTSNNSFRSDVSFENDEENISVRNDEEANVTGGKKYEHLDEEIYLNARRTKFEAMLLIWNFTFRNNLTASATEDLCKMVNCLLGNDFIPTTKYMFNQIFGFINYTFNFYCPTCRAFISSLLKSHRADNVQLECPICDYQGNTENLNDGNFFVTLPVKDQLLFFLENTPEILDFLQYRWSRAVNEDEICDIFDGFLYKKLVDDGILSDPHSFSLTFATDGVSLYKRCKNTLWPIHFRINELPPSKRFELSHSMLAGVWFGKHEPDMSLFLHSFLREANELFHQGLHWRAPTGQLINSRVVLLDGVMDSKARPLVQNMKYHNGFFGCGYCYHPGVTFEGSTQVKYPLNDDLDLMDDLSFTYTVDAKDRTTQENRVFRVLDRSDEGCREDMETAENLRQEQGRLGPGNNDDYFGVKGKNPFFELPYFDVVLGFPVDYLHGVLLGCVKTLASLWLDSPAHRNFSIKDREDDIDAKLLSISPPSSISRRPRSLKERCFWRANEWRSWLLYYSLPCLDGILPVRFLRHYCILVTASHIMLSDKITLTELDRATEFLGQYVQEYCQLYQPPQMFFNTHLLLHMGRMVRALGPWWCYSSFTFESSNGCLVKLVKGIKGEATQIAEKYSMSKILPSVIDLYHVSEDILNFSSEIMCYRHSKVAERIGNSITILGAYKCIPLSPFEREAFLRAGHNATNCTYERMIKDGIKFHSQHYSRQGEKSNDSIAKLENGSYIKIGRILVLNDRQTQERSVYVLARTLKIEDNNFITSHQCGARASHIKICAVPPYNEEYNIIRAEEIQCKCILMEVADLTFVTGFPNRFEKD